MSQENVELVRAVYERWSRGDFGASLDLFDPHVLFVLPPEFPDAGTYLGTERIAAYMRGFLEPWQHLAIEAAEFTDAGDSVIAAVRQHGLGRESGIPTELSYFQVWSFRGPKVIRLENFRERAKALEASGLRE
jgi:ketosteroid isomerase-like protein